MPRAGGQHIEVSLADHLLAASTRADASVRSLSAAVDAGREHLGPDHPAVLAATRSLAALHKQVGDLSSARTLLESALAAGQFSRGDTDPTMLGLAYDLALIADELENRHEARRNFDKVRTFGPAALGPDHEWVQTATRYLGLPPGAPTPGVPTPGAPTPGVPAQRAPAEGPTGDTPVPPAAGSPPRPAVGRAKVPARTDPDRPVVDGSAADQPAAGQPVALPAAAQPTPPQDLSTHPATATARPAPPVSAPPAPPTPPVSAPPVSAPPVSAPPAPAPPAPPVTAPPVSAPPIVPAVAAPSEPVPPAVAPHALGMPVGIPISATPAALRTAATGGAFDVPVRRVPAHRNGSRRGPVVLVVVLILAVLAAAVVLVTYLSGRRDPGPESAPPAPSPSAAAVRLDLRDDGASVALTWSDPTGGQTAYVVTYGRADGPADQTRQVPAGTATLIVDRLNPRQDYCFTVAGEAGAGVPPSPVVCTRRPKASAGSSRGSVSKRR